MAANQSQPQWAQRLLSLLQEQRAVYEHLRTFSEKQSHLVEQGDAENLLQLLALRQQLIDKLAALNEQLEPFKKDWPRLWSELDEPTRRGVDGLVKEVQGVVDGIVEQDDADRQVLARKRDAVASELSQIRSGAKVNRAYGSSNNHDNTRLTDSHG